MKFTLNWPQKTLCLLPYMVRKYQLAINNNSLVTLLGQEVRTSKKSLSSKRHKDVILPFTKCYSHQNSFYLDTDDISLS
jgi:hypothetical protein